MRRDRYGQLAPFHDRAGDGRELWPEGQSGPAAAVLSAWIKRP